jgi:hypothetical protein
LGNPRSPFCPDGDRYILGGQHGFEASGEIHDDYLKKNQDPPKWCSHFNAKVIKGGTSLQIRRKISGAHNKVQHAGSTSVLSEIGLAFLIVYHDPKLSHYSISDAVLATYENTGMSVKGEEGGVVCPTLSKAVLV